MNLILRSTAQVLGPATVAALGPVVEGAVVSESSPHAAAPTPRATDGLRIQWAFFDMSPPRVITGESPVLLPQTGSEIVSIC
jgi:hypothetical protein